MAKVQVVRRETAPVKHRARHPDFAYTKREIVPGDSARKCAVSVYEIPPGKAAYPYHYHTGNEEVFYILSGTGLLKTPEGSRTVSPGDFLFFPACPAGAHKLSNASEAEPLVYIDFDTRDDIDVAFYPDSGKVGIWGKDLAQVYPIDAQVDYYEGE